MNLDSFIEMEKLNSKEVEQVIKRIFKKEVS